MLRVTLGWRGVFALGPDQNLFGLEGLFFFLGLLPLPVPILVVLAKLLPRGSTAIRKAPAAPPH